MRLNVFFFIEFSGQKGYPATRPGERILGPTGDPGVPGFPGVTGDPGRPGKHLTRIDFVLVSKFSHTIENIKLIRLNL